MASSETKREQGKVEVLKCHLCKEDKQRAEIRYGLNDLTEHVARHHYDFFLYQCNKCNMSFVTPFGAAYHVRKQGQCASTAEESSLSYVIVDDVNIDDFSIIESTVAKSLDNLLSNLHDLPEPYGRLVENIEKKSIETISSCCQTDCSPVVQETTGPRSPDRSKQTQTNFTTIKTEEDIPITESKETQTNRLEFFYNSRINMVDDSKDASTSMTPISSRTSGYSTNKTTNNKLTQEILTDLAKRKDSYAAPQQKQTTLSPNRKDLSKRRRRSRSRSISPWRVDAKRRDNKERDERRSKETEKRSKEAGRRDRERKRRDDVRSSGRDRSRSRKRSTRSRGRSESARRSKTPAPAHDKLRRLSAEEERERERKARKEDTADSRKPLHVVVPSTDERTGKNLLDSNDSSEEGTVIAVPPPVDQSILELLKGSPAKPAVPLTHSQELRIAEAVAKSIDEKSRIEKCWTQWVEGEGNVINKRQPINEEGEIPDSDTPPSDNQNTAVSTVIDHGSSPAEQLSESSSASNPPPPPPPTAVPEKLLGLVSALFFSKNNTNEPTQNDMHALADTASLASGSVSSEELEKTQPTVEETESVPEDEDLRISYPPIKVAPSKPTIHININLNSIPLPDQPEQQQPSGTVEVIEKGYWQERQEQEDKSSSSEESIGELVKRVTVPVVRRQESAWNVANMEMNKLNVATDESSASSFSYESVVQNHCAAVLYGPEISPAMSEYYEDLQQFYHEAASMQPRQRKTLLETPAQPPNEHQYWLLYNDDEGLQSYWQLLYDDNYISIISAKKHNVQKLLKTTTSSMPALNPIPWYKNMVTHASEERMYTSYFFYNNPYMDSNKKYRDDFMLKKERNPLTEWLHFAVVSNKFAEDMQMKKLKANELRQRKDNYDDDDLSVEQQSVHLARNMALAVLCVNRMIDAIELTDNIAESNMLLNLDNHEDAHLPSADNAYMCAQLMQDDEDEMDLAKLINMALDTPYQQTLKEELNKIEQLEKEEIWASRIVESEQKFEDYCQWLEKEWILDEETADLYEYLDDGTVSTEEDMEVEAPEEAKYLDRESSIDEKKDVDVLPADKENFDVAQDTKHHTSRNEVITVGDTDDEVLSENSESRCLMAEQHEQSYGAPTGVDQEESEEEEEDDDHNNDENEEEEEEEEKEDEEDEKEEEEEEEKYEEEDDDEDDVLWIENDKAEKSPNGSMCLSAPTSPNRLSEDFDLGEDSENNERDKSELGSVLSPVSPELDPHGEVENDGEERSERLSSSSIEVLSERSGIPAASTSQDRDSEEDSQNDEEEAEFSDDDDPEPVSDEDMEENMSEAYQSVSDSGGEDSFHQVVVVNAERQMKRIRERSANEEETIDEKRRKLEDQVEYGRLPNYPRMQIIVSPDGNRSALGDIESRVMRGGPSPRRMNSRGGGHVQNRRSHESFERDQTVPITGRISRGGRRDSQVRYDDLQPDERQRQQGREHSRHRRSGRSVDRGRSRGWQRGNRHGPPDRRNSNDRPRSSQDYTPTMNNQRGGSDRARSRNWRRNSHGIRQRRNSSDAPHSNQSVEATRGANSRGRGGDRGRSRPWRPSRGNSHEGLNRRNSADGAAQSSNPHHGSNNRNHQRWREQNNWRGRFANRNNR